jgi:ABC-type antimicrobial peptide transport system permease subunit
MTLARLILRSLRHYRWTHLGVALGAAVATAVLVGAMIVGDSIRHSLRSIALARLGGTHLAIHTGERYFTLALADALASDLAAPAAPLLDLSAVASQPGTRGGRANGVRVLGVDDRFWKLGGVHPSPLSAEAENQVVINTRLAEHLSAAPGSRLILRVARPSALPRDVPLGSQVDDSITLSLTITAVVGDEQFGRYGLKVDQVPPFNAFVPLKALQQAAGVAGRINTLLIGSPVDGATAESAIRRRWTPADAEAELRPLGAIGGVELRSTRVFLESTLVDAALQADSSGLPILTYFVNELAAGSRSVPYSIVSSRADLSPDRLIVNRWLADDLGVKVGDAVRLTYFVLGENRRLNERTSTFTIQGVEPTEGPGGDRELLPQFPGLADVDSSRDWKPGIPIDLTRIRDIDDDYWKKHRGTPKAFVPLEWAKSTWGNRYGNLTAIRWSSGDAEVIAQSMRERLDPASFGLRFQPVRESALRAASSGQDFGQLFIGLSFFLIAAALLLTGLLFLFGIERRATEIGTLLSLGYTPSIVRRLLLGEGAALAAIGGLVGVALGTGYTRGVLWALRSMWRDAVGTSTLGYHAEPATPWIGWLIGIATAVGTMAWAMRKMLRQPARLLLASRFGTGAATGAAGRWTTPAVIVCIAGSVILIVTAGQEAAAGAFFGAGSMLLIAGLLFTRRALAGAAGAASVKLTLARLAWRNGGRRAGRSLATVAMLACGAFLIVAINAFRAGPVDVTSRASGTGGFSLFAVTTLPVHHDLNAPDGREHYGLDAARMKDVAITAMRLKEGDEASCLNLNRPQQPPLLGVDPRKLDALGAFTFVKATADRPWLALQDMGEAIPAIIDDNVAMWVLHKSIGDEIDYIDEQGRTARLRIVGTLAQSVLQGYVLVADADLSRLFPSLAGSRVMLIDAPPGATDQTARLLEQRLADAGLTTMRTDRRLALFKSVENTYLSIFSVLGGLGLVVGVIGLGLVVMRNVLERRSELGLMRAVGFDRAVLRRLVGTEHALLLSIGLGIGTISAAAAITPALLRPGAWPPVGWLAGLLGLTLASGLACTAIAARAAVRGTLVDALRDE